MSSSPKLQIFSDDPNLGWNILEAECHVQINANIKIQDITWLTELYMKCIQRLNSAQDKRQSYFSSKMQKLMAEPYVIRCFNNQSEGKKGQMEHKKKELEQRLSLEVEKNHPERLQEMITQFNQKQIKIKSRISQILSHHDRALEERLMKRQANKPSSYIVSEHSCGTSDKSSDTEKVSREANPQKTAIKKHASEIISLEFP